MKTCENFVRQKPLNAKDDTVAVFFSFANPKPKQMITEMERIEENLNNFLFIFYCENEERLLICA